MIAAAVLSPWSKSPIDEAKLNRVRAAEADDGVATVSAAELGSIFGGMVDGNE